MVLVRMVEWRGVEELYEEERVNGLVDSLNL
jgi:hypothetical protein